MRKKIIFCILILVSLTFNSCEENIGQDLFKTNENKVIVDSDLFRIATSENYTITNVELDNDILNITIATSGCNGETFKAVLIDSNIMLASLPPQRQLRLVLEKREDCEALISKTFPFDIKLLKEPSSEIILNLEGWQNQIKY